MMKWVNNVATIHKIPVKQDDLMYIQSMSHVIDRHVMTSLLLAILVNSVVLGSTPPNFIFDINKVL